MMANGWTHIMRRCPKCGQFLFRKSNRRIKSGATTYGKLLCRTCNEYHIPTDEEKEIWTPRTIVEKKSTILKL